MKRSIIFSSVLLLGCVLLLVSFSKWGEQDVVSSPDDVLADDGNAQLQQNDSKPDSSEATPAPEPIEEHIKEEPAVDASLVPYNGIVEHVFFHPLIAFPELAFDGDYMEQGYHDYFTTIAEFNRIIEELYKRQFILVHLSDVYEEVNGLIQAKTLMLPEGKKPLVISIDDLNYYEYMIEHGNVHKLILDDKGRVATYAMTPEGKELLSYTNEIVPLLDTFVEKHPDFSHNGAKGTIALTGYEGILGYRTQVDAPNRTAEIEAVKPIVQALKDSGWLFASHSYGHVNVTKASLADIVADTKRWKAEVEPLVGATPLFLYPYGARADYGDEKFNYLVANGYKVLAAVGPTSYTRITNGAYTMDRRHLDGIAFALQPETLRDLFDVEQIVDYTLRPAKYFTK